MGLRGIRLKLLDFNKKDVFVFLKVELPMTTQPKTNLGFTLIELIIVIVILGILSAVAIPKYQDISEEAEFNTIIKIAYDTLSTVPGAFKAIVDLKGQNPATVKLSDLITIRGGSWEFDDTLNEYHRPGLSITLYPDLRRVSLYLKCNDFTSPNLVNKCKTKFNLAGNPPELVEEVSF